MGKIVLIADHYGFVIIIIFPVRFHLGMIVKYLGEITQKPAFLVFVGLSYNL